MKVIVKIAGFDKKADAEGLAKHLEKEEHPFSKCMEELKDQYPDAEVRKKVCGKAKSKI